MAEHRTKLNGDEPQFKYGLDVGSHLIAHVTPETLTAAQRASLIHRSNDGLNRLSILVVPAAPPTDGVRNDGIVDSFIATGPWTRTLARISAQPKDWCYLVLQEALNSDVIPSIDVHGAGEPAISSQRFPTIDVIVPHRGASAHLAACVSSLLRQTLECNIAIGLDQRCGPAESAIVASNNRIKGFAVSNAPQGPYVVRQFLAARSTAEFIAFQDSDDLSLPTRLAELTDAAMTSRADIVGCHELRLDEIERAVYAIRFPSDVTAALQMTASHPQFFPTTVVNRTYFEKHGGFSTDMHFGADTEFLLRSHFTAHIRNVDRFLYVRRRRAGSLTTAPDTALGSPVRLALDQKWKSDFAAIKRGALDLESSSLALRCVAHHPRIEPI